MVKPRYSDSDSKISKLRNRLKPQKENYEQRIKDLETRMGAGEITTSDLREQVGKLNHELLEMRENDKVSLNKRAGMLNKLDALEKELAHYRRQDEYVVLHQLAINLESHLKDLVLMRLSPCRKVLFCYKDGTLKPHGVQFMDVREEMEADTKIETFILQTYFQKSWDHFRDFRDTVSALKRLYNVIAPPSTFENQPINFTILEDLIDRAPINPYQKGRSKAYAAWIYQGD